MGSSGWITTRLQRRMNTRTNRKSWSRSSTQSSRSCTLEELVVHQVVVCLVEPLPPPVVLALPSRRWTDLLPYRRRPRPVQPVTSHWILGLYCQSPVIGSL